MGKSLRTLLAIDHLLDLWQRQCGMLLLDSQAPLNVLKENTLGTPTFLMAKLRDITVLRTHCLGYQEGRSSTTHILWGGPILGPEYHPWDRVLLSAQQDSAPWGLTLQLSNHFSRLPVRTWICGTAPRGKVLHPWCQRQYRWARYRGRTRVPGQPALPQPRSRGLRPHKRPYSFWAVCRVGTSLRIRSWIVSSGRRTLPGARSLPARPGKGSRAWI